MSTKTPSSDATALLRPSQNCSATSPTTTPRKVDLLAAVQAVEATR